MILAPSRAGFENPSMKNTGHNLLTASLTNMHRFPPILMTGHDQDEVQGTMMLHHERSNLSPPPPPRAQRSGCTEQEHSNSDQQHRAPSNSPLCRQSPPPPQQPPQPDPTNGRNYIPEQVGRSMYDSLKILGLGLGASEREVKLAYRRLTSIFHPDRA